VPTGLLHPGSELNHLTQFSVKQQGDDFFQRYPDKKGLQSESYTFGVLLGCLAKASTYGYGDLLGVRALHCRLLTYLVHPPFLHPLPPQKLKEMQTDGHKKQFTQMPPFIQLIHELESARGQGHTKLAKLVEIVSEHFERHRSAGEPAPYIPESSRKMPHT
jgi:hypothetical protein